MPRLISHELLDELYERLNGREIDKYLNHAVLFLRLRATALALRGPPVSR